MFRLERPLSSYLPLKQLRQASDSGHTGARKLSFIDVAEVCFSVPGQTKKLEEIDKNTRYAWTISYLSRTFLDGGHQTTIA